MFGAGKLKLRQGLESQLCRWIWYVIFVLGLIFAPVSIRHPLPVLGQSVRAGTAGCQAAGSAGAPGGGSTDKRGCKAGAACSAGEGIPRTAGSTRGRERFISRVQALLVLFQLLKRVLFHRSTSYRFSSSLLDAHEVLLLRKRL